jgi:monoamine oxidase
MIYDFIIVGGGISGLYVCHCLIQQNPNYKIILIEKENEFGGRIHTYSDKFMTVEAGAGRFNNSHYRLIKLIHELGLAKKITKTSSSAVYIPLPILHEHSSNNTVSNKKCLETGDKRIENSILDHKETNLSFFDPILFRALDANLGKETLPNAGLITKILIASQFESRHDLQSQTFEKYALKTVGKKDLDFIKSSFGYYSELVLMNAYDALKLMINLGPQNQFYTLSGGLSQIIDELVVHIKKKGNFCKLSLKCQMNNIRFVEKEQLFYVNTDKDKTIIAKQCICAVTKNVLEKIPLFKPLINSVFNRIHCGTLCRIYCKFDVLKGHHLWFKNIPKFTTNSYLRMVIPYDVEKGIIMMSYTDNYFADFWNVLFVKKGEKGVAEKLLELMEEVMECKIPIPMKTVVFYWKCGVGYWGKHADSHLIQEKIVHPYSEMPLFICGENFSENNQQWMEGGLDTAEKVLQVLLPYT